jgi:N-acetyl-anhydromuramyl-L-alanine amidase AmpD
MSTAFHASLRLFPVWAALLSLATLLGGCSLPGEEFPRRGDEIVVCGRLFHTGTPIVLWTDPGGYDGYRTEKRFAPWAKSAFQPPAKPGESPSTPNRYSIRFAPLEEKPSDAAAPTPPPSAPTPPASGEPPRLTPEEFERIRGGNWDLDLLRTKVDQFVLHYDVCGTSRQCFRVLHDLRGLSVHFMLDIDGTIYQTMDVKERAWHATYANDRSVGVEIANIGASGAGEKDPFDAWYRRDPAPSHGGTVGETTLRITVPPAYGDGGIRTPNFVGYPDRADPILGEIQGKLYRQFDFTPEQYASLIKLTAALHRVLPSIELDYPRDEHGNPIQRTISREQWASFHGVLGHYHLQDNKIDPGPAMQWDRVINGARKLHHLPPLSHTDNICP